MGRVGGHGAESGGGDRILWVDYAKGIGIVLVVVGHVLNGLWSSGILAEDSALKWVRSWIYSFHMHLFFLLSGLFLERQVARPAGMFLADKLRTIAYPYFVWSSLQFAIHSSLRGVTNNTADLGELWTIVYLPTMQFWFLFTLFLLVLGYYVLARFGLGPLAILGVFTAWRQAAGILPTGTWWPLGTVRWYGVYLALGAVLHRYQFSERAARLRTTVLLALSGLGFTAVGLGVSRGWDQGLWSSTGIALCGIVASLGLALTMDRGRARVREVVGAILPGDLRRSHDRRGRGAGRVAEDPGHLRSLDSHPHGMPRGAVCPDRAGMDW